MSDHIVYYSLVGDRAIPVVMPIFYLLKKENNRNKPADITLIFYNKISKVTAERATQFLKKEFTDRVQVNIMSYSDFMNILKQGIFNEQAYVNLSPGMNWQVAETVVNLPKSTACFYMDYRYLYTYKNLDTPISENDKERISINLTIENYQFLNPDIRVIKKPHIFVKEYNNDERVYSCVFLNYHHFWQSGPIINQSLVSVQERGGFLYLLFDVTETGIHQAISGPEVHNPFLYLYRIIKGSFNPLNYGITIITNNEWLKLRAERDGVSTIYISPETDINKEIKKWTESPPDPKKKTYDIHIQTQEAVGHQNSQFSSALFVCIGDNVVPALIAIKSHKNLHNIEKVFLFYDKKSERINLLAHKLASVFNNRQQITSNPFSILSKKLSTVIAIPGIPIIILAKILAELFANKNANLPTIVLLKTDHIGSGMAAHVERIINSNRGADFYFNITSGTKAQTIALTQAAIKHNLIDRLYSIDAREGRIRRIYDGKEAGPLAEVSPQEIIEFYSPKYREHSNIALLDKQKYLWDDILKGLAKGSLIYVGGGIEKLKDKKTNQFPYKGSMKELSEWLDFLKIKDEDRKSRAVGLWWELVTYHAVVKHNISNEILFSTIFQDASDQHISELDLVFSYDKNIVVISCKTTPRNIDLDALYLVSEAKSRFGRMAVCMISVPFYRGDQWIHVRDNDIVRVITARELDDKKRLHKAIQSLIEKLSTTQRQ